ncbi:kunitz-type serine protease inhibitor A-like [Rhipicephalus sanguineus]|uniref:kunitz-type serine protease inhibitor A-like n=1 Tax=Rhipicephalus sanguineus TaxID=34632 RepID=UPI0020C25935|nr:kunitz-type serine protease inhibitor A-like [Rhipicephalus sanguineus]
MAANSGRASASDAAPTVENVACLGKPDPGPCRASVTRYYYDNGTSTCKEFTYGGCEGNPNNYETFEECRASCNPATEYEAKCLARPELGPCRSRLVAWAYNARLGQCKSFMYGGCDGNENNYGTKEKCEAACKHPSADARLNVGITNFESEPVPTNTLCYEPKKVGPCKAYVPRYFYNTTTKFCEGFVYGGGK